MQKDFAKPPMYSTCSPIYGQKRRKILALQKSYADLTDSAEKKALLKSIQRLKVELRKLPCKHSSDKKIAYVRYADDFLIGVCGCGSKQDCKFIKETLKDFLAKNLKLELSEEKTKIKHSSQPVRFPSYDIRVRRSSLCKRRNIKKLYKAGHSWSVPYQCKNGATQRIMIVLFKNLRKEKVYTSDDTLDDIAILKVSLPFWLYLHLSFACKLFIEAGLKVQFLLLLIGKTGSLKTTICETFAEPFNEGSMLRFESTSRALELYREECIDQTMVVDDIFKKKASNMSKFEDILRAFGEGIGRAKSAGKDFKEIIRTKVQGGCIVTAEHDLDSQQSSALRYISVPLESESIDTDALDIFQADKIHARIEGRPTIVQEIFASWISYLELNYEQIVNFLLTFQPPPLTLKFKRHQQIYKVFCAVAVLINEWGLQSRSITIR